MSTITGEYETYSQIVGEQRRYSEANTDDFNEAEKLFWEGVRDERELRKEHVQCRAVYEATKVVLVKNSTGVVLRRVDIPGYAPGQ